MGRKERFIQFVVDFCEDDSHGYSQYDRWGQDCDCSSLMYRAANAAGYDVPTGRGHTGTMVSDFVAAGWTAVPFDGNVWDCAPGDIMLNVSDHTEAVVDWGKFGGAHIDEHGGIVGCCPGDQTGREVSICTAYVFCNGWDYVLIPPDDDGQQDAPHEQPSASGPRYRVYTREHRWLSWMVGETCTCTDPTCTDDFAGMEGEWIYGIEADFHFKVVLMDGTESGWVTLWEDSGQAVRGIKIEDMRYQAHFCGAGWGKVENGMTDDGAGDDVHALDMLKVL